MFHGCSILLINALGFSKDNSNGPGGATSGEINQWVVFQFIIIIQYFLPRLIA